MKNIKILLIVLTLVSCSFKEAGKVLRNEN